MEFKENFLYETFHDNLKTPLHIAIENNNIDMVKLLLKNPEIDINIVIILNT